MRPWLFFRVLVYFDIHIGIQVSKFISVSSEMRKMLNKIYCFTRICVEKPGFFVTLSVYLWGNGIQYVSFHQNIRSALETSLIVFSLEFHLVQSWGLQRITETKLSGKRRKVWTLDSFELYGGAMPRYVDQLPDSLVYVAIRINSEVSRKWWKFATFQTHLIF